MPKRVVGDGPMPVMNTTIDVCRADFVRPQCLYPGTARLLLEMSKLLVRMFAECNCAGV